MSGSSRRYVELVAVAVIAAALSAATPASAHGVRHALFAHKAGNAKNLGGKPASAYALKETLAALEARVEELEAKLAAVSYNDGAKLLTISGANVRIVDGSGNTGGVPNGLGNLIIGYNTDNLTGSGQGDDQTDVRPGSHNLVIGDDHTYSNTGGIVAGLNNAITGVSASVTGGENNAAGGFFSAVTGGQGNAASDDFASVVGGLNNTAGSNFASVLGGQHNAASGLYATVAGGELNDAVAESASVTGGSQNRASGDSASVTGGFANTASGTNASITGGAANIANAFAAAVTGGANNIADAANEWIGGSFLVRASSVVVPGAGTTEGNGSYNSAVATALCAADEQFIGGGAFWDIDDDTKELNIVYPRIVTVGSQTGWRVRGGNDTSADRTLTVQAFCLGE
jgi:hypothetical protein